MKTEKEITENIQKIWDEFQIIYEKEFQKATIDAFIYGCGAIELNDFGGIKHVPIKDSTWLK